MPDNPPVHLEIELKGTTHKELWDNLLKLVSQAINHKRANGHEWPLMVGASGAGSIKVKKNKYT